MTSIRVNLVLITVFASGCATASVTPPQQPTHETSHVFQASYDDIWERAVDWFSESNIPIRQIEKASGLIASEHRLGADDEMLDCGEVSSGDEILRDSERTAHLNVRVRRAGDDVRVQMDVFGRAHFIFFNPMLSSTNRLEVPRCESTGELEDSLFRYIRASLGR
jgi:hypothetical protein